VSALCSALAPQAQPAIILVFLVGSYVALALSQSLAGFGHFVTLDKCRFRFMLHWDHEVESGGQKVHKLMALQLLLYLSMITDVVKPCLEQPFMMYPQVDLASSWGATGVVAPSTGSPKFIQVPVQ